MTAFPASPVRQRGASLVVVLILLLVMTLLGLAVLRTPLLVLAMAWYRMRDALW